MAAESRKSSPRASSSKEHSRRTRRPQAKASSQRASANRLDRPFAAEILKQARQTVGEYQIVLECEDAHWYGRGLEMPHVFGDGKSPAACIDDTRQALLAAVAYLVEQGQFPPPPARQGRRTQQVNVRLTAEEKAILEGTARRRGFEGLSDFMRAAAMEAVR